MENEGVANAVEHARNSLVDLDLSGAYHWLDLALTRDYDDATTLALLKFLQFWKDRIQRLSSCESDYDRADFLISQWPLFQGFCEHIGYWNEKDIDAVRRYVFGVVLKYMKTYDTVEGVRDPGVLLRVGLCYKVMGDYERARRFFETALGIDQTDPRILSELADVLALLDEEDASKLLFRESFYLDPEAVMLDTLESALIRRLIDSVSKVEGVTKASLPYWLPVYAVVGGVFTVRRELKPAEYGQLRQDIYALERAWQEEPERHDILRPALLNKYFWFLDHARQTQQARHVTDEILLKIESLHPDIYKLYTR